MKSRILPINDATNISAIAPTTSTAKAIKIPPATSTIVRRVYGWAPGKCLICLGEEGYRGKRGSGDQISRASLLAIASATDMTPSRTQLHLAVKDALCQDVVGSLQVHICPDSWADGWFTAPLYRKTTGRGSRELRTEAPMKRCNTNPGNGRVVDPANEATPRSYGSPSGVVSPLAL